MAKLPHLTVYDVRLMIKAKLWPGPLRVVTCGLAIENMLYLYLQVLVMITILFSLSSSVSDSSLLIKFSLRLSVLHRDSVVHVRLLKRRRHPLVNFFKIFIFLKRKSSLTNQF